MFVFYAHILRLQNYYKKLTYANLLHKSALFYGYTILYLHMSKKSSTFASDMKKGWIIAIMTLCALGCSKPSRVEQYKAEKHVRDSARLEEQERSLAYYESQLELLLPKADSLMQYFTYEKNEKYQDRGNYVIKGESLRILVRDDGKEMLVYKEGKRLTTERVNELRNEGNKAVARADELQVTISDIKELEKRMARTSSEIQKYQKRLQKH